MSNTGTDLNGLNITMESLNKWLRELIAALRGARTLAYLNDMSRVLRSVLLSTLSLIQRFPI